jgi:hypothetical protein
MLTTLRPLALCLAALFVLACASDAPAFTLNAKMLKGYYEAETETFYAFGDSVDTSDMSIYMSYGNMHLYNTATGDQVWLIEGQLISALYRADVPPQKLVTAVSQYLGEPEEGLATAQDEVARWITDKIGTQVFDAATGTQLMVSWMDVEQK